VRYLRHTHGRRSDYAESLVEELRPGGAHQARSWESLLPRARYVGEVGLDAGPRYFRTLELQKRIFERVLQACNREGAKILSVHSVRSITLVLDMVEKYIDRGKVRVVLHWFTGSTSKARRATQLGCYFSINEQMATSPRSAKVVASLPAIVCSPKQMAHSQAL
jgi:TatD DNase family protein